MKKKLICILFILLFFLLIKAEKNETNENILISECYDKIGNKKIKIQSIVSFGHNKYEPPKKSNIVIFEIDKQGRIIREIGSRELCFACIPMKLIRVNIKSKNEIIYLVLTKGHRNRYSTIKITKKDVIIIWEEIGFGFLDEEVLDIDNDGTDEIILHRTPISLEEKDTIKSKYVKEIYKYINGTFKKIKELDSFEDFYIYK
ncbi:MAG: hypothetical protein QXJ06_05450 [Candidatus Aenigmatarchaeota archaeon]